MNVKVEGLKRYFGKTKAVDDISFEFHSGQVYGFVGPNGSGKTTTMRIMATLDEPTAGDVLIDGTSVVEYPEMTRRSIGFVPDALPDHQDITTHDYVDFFARAYGLTGSRRRSVVETIEDFTGLTAFRDKVLSALSKGMKQRVSVARALVHDPPVLILDEPAAGLDPRARIELRELIRALAQRGKAMLISSHILTELSEICDGAVIIELGKILRAGSIETLQAEHWKHTTVLIRILGSQEDLHRHLLEMPFVQAARLTGRGVEADVAGNDEACSQVLAGLMQAKLDVVEFTHRRADLEDLFMNVTKGKVQ